MALYKKIEKASAKRHARYFKKIGTEPCGDSGKVCARCQKTVPTDRLHYPDQKHEDKCIEVPVIDKGG